MSQSRRLAAIMFSDIVGYTAMMQRDETDGLQRVKLYKQELESLVNTHDGEILQHYGDGSLTIFSSAVEGARCAKALQESLKGKVPIKIGMHIGDIILEEENIYGDGVNLASRIESIGQAGTVFFSKEIYDKIRNLPEFELTSLGTFAFKNVQDPLEVFALSNEGFAVPKKRDLKGKFIRSNPNSINKWLVPSLIGMVALVVLWFYLPNRQPQAPLLALADIVDQSIAVMPFTNMNQHEEGQLFCDGMMEDILIQLSKIKELKVISRTSAMHYQNTNKKVPEIARELGVAHIVEGSVRTYGNKARINVQLIDAVKDEQIWAENYDRNLTDIFEVQSEVSQKIVQALQMKITPRESQNLAAAQHHDPEAYQLFVKGKRAADSRTKSGLAQSAVQLEEAISMDTAFADAYANLAYTKFLQARYEYEDPSKSDQEAEELAKKALQKDEQNVLAHQVLGGIAHRKGEFEKAKEMHDKGLEVTPNNPLPHHGLGQLYAATGEYEKELEHRKKVIELDPLIKVYHKNYIEVLTKTGQVEKAKKQLDKAKKLFPEALDELESLEGDIFFSDEDFEGAIEHYTHSVEENPHQAVKLAYSYAKTGDEDRTKEAIFLIPDDDPVEYFKDIAIVHSGLGHTDSALYYLGHSIEHGLQQAANQKFQKFKVKRLRRSLEKDSFFEDLRNSEEFKKLMEKIDTP